MCITTIDTSGLYDFMVTNPDTLEVAVVNARFTYVWTTTGEKNVWKIKTHHSSKLPNALGGAMTTQSLRHGNDQSWLNQDLVKF